MLRENREHLELEKCSVEIAKLVAESRKLVAEEKKIRREATLYPFATVAGVTTAVVALLAFLQK